LKLEKDYFIGKEALVKQKEHGIDRKLVGFEMVDRGIPRSHYEVQAGGKNIGFVTTGSFSPTLKTNIGLALVSVEYSAEGTEFEVIVRNKPLKAQVVKIPFYEKKYRK
jgi:aminomethyltransferase